VIACCILAAPFILQQGTLYNLTPECEWQTKYGKACSLCGMTHSFILISSGRFSKAMAVNQHAFFLYAIFIFNSTVFLCIVLKWTLIDSPRKTIKILLIQNSSLGCASVLGYSPQTRSFRSSDSIHSRSATANITGAHVAPSTSKAVRVSPSRPLCGLVSEHCLRKRPSFLASKRFAQENPTPCSSGLLRLIKK
jgi:hypothetical protein